MSSSLVLELRQAAIHAFLAIPRRGVEIGGLLFGKVRLEAPVEGQRERVVLELAAFEDVPCEHRFGPSYTLDEPDRQRLAEVVARHERDGSPPIVGFYRSYTGREARMDDEEQKLIRSFLPHRHFFCLLLQPTSIGKCDASFRFWSNGEMLPEPVDAPIPFDAGLMTQDAPEAPEPALPGMARPSKRRLPESLDDYDVEPAAPRPAGRFQMLPALCCILAAIALMTSYALWKVTRLPQWAQVRLDARPSGGKLLLSWDAAAPAVALATSGTLTATGGGAPVETQLGPEQVHRGALALLPSGENVRFRLRLYNQEKAIADDSLRVILLPSLAPMTGVPAPPAAPAAPAAAASSPRVLHEVQPEISPGIRTRIQARVVVPVVVAVDESGRVTRASARVATKDGLDRYLADQAVKAARQWSFSPARSSDGSPLAGTTTISFEFTPAQ